MLAQALAYPKPVFPLVSQPLEIRVGGAIVFVLPVERFEKT